MKNVVGKPVQGVNFFGRAVEVAELRQIVEDEHVLMLAPRRVGKTSLLLALERSLEHDECTPVYVSVTALDAAIARLLERKVYFSYWDERLASALGSPDDDHARRVLRVCATDPRGAVASTLQRALAAVISDVAQRSRTLTWILDVLHNDGYLVLADKRWRFRSGLLRRYWRSHVR